MQFHVVFMAVNPIFLYYCLYLLQDQSHIIVYELTFIVNFSGPVLEYQLENSFFSNSACCRLILIVNSRQGRSSSYPSPPRDPLTVSQEVETQNAWFRLHCQLFAQIIPQSSVHQSSGFCWYIIFIPTKAHVDAQTHIANTLRMKNKNYCSVSFLL